jgi:RNA polymerase sigma-70 factor (ECF subfamily)
VVPTDDTPTLAGGPPRDVQQIYVDHAQFVWASLQRLGIRDSDLQDVHQEVFVIVHKRLHAFEGESTLTTWIFGICARVAANYRRLARVRREQVVAEVPEASSRDEHGPEAGAIMTQNRARLQALLDGMDPEKRAVFVMFELEETPCSEIAEMLGVPVGTVYSRLHAARKQFDAAVAAEHEGGQSG